MHDRKKMYAIAILTCINTLEMFKEKLLFYSWQFVVHGGIDGFSHMIAFLVCSTNNRASTVLQYCKSAVDKFGLPSHVRSDKGGKNTEVAWYMLSHPLRGPDRGSHNAGKSVHNQQIERLWRGVLSGCTYLFYNLFYHMEDKGILNPSNEQHLAVLHYAYVPIINRHLMFVHRRSQQRTHKYRAKPIPRANMV